MLLALGLRLAHFGESLWVDELHTAWTAAGSFTDIPRRATLGNNSPLYFYFPWVVEKLLGYSELSLRLPSLAAGLLLVPAVYTLAFWWSHSLTAALLAAFLAAIDDHFIFFGVEARTYALVQLVGLVQAALFWRLLTVPSGKLRLVFATLTVVLFYLHYTAALLIVAELICYAAMYGQSRLRPTWRVRDFALDLCLVALACIPAWPQLAFVASRRANWASFVPRPSPEDLWTLFPLDAYLLVPTVVTLGVVAVRGMSGKLPLVRRVDPGAMVWAVCWLAVPLLLAWLACSFDLARLFHRRYLMVSATAPILIGALLVGMLPRRSLRIAATIVVACAAVWPASPAVSLWQQHHLAPHRTEDWRGAAAMLSAAPKGRTWPIFLQSGLIEADDLENKSAALYQEDLREYCLFPITSLYHITGGVHLLIPLSSIRAGGILQENRRLVENRGGMWLVVRGSEKTVKQATDAALSALQVGPSSIVQRGDFGGVQVLGIAVKEQKQ